MKKILYSILLAFVLWTIMFSPWTAPHINFWLCMASSACLLTLLVYFTGEMVIGKADKGIGDVRYAATEILLGVAIAAALWGVFWIGDKASQWLFPSFARMQVNSIYGMKDGMSGVVLSGMLLMIIGPAEEYFWRGFIQRRLAEHTGSLPTFQLMGLRFDNRFWAFCIATLIYALVHLFSFNFMLIMAALVCGVAWGGLYWLFPKHFPAIVLSHALWDAAVFIWWPI